MAFIKRSPPVFNTSVHFVKSTAGKTYPVLYMTAEYNGKKTYLKLTRMFAKALLENLPILQSFADAAATNDWTRIGIPIHQEDGNLLIHPVVTQAEDTATKSIAEDKVEEMLDVTDERITFK